jgi:NADH:ubiquinone oxidoreductase subunit 6 (subunit J)
MTSLVVNPNGFCLVEKMNIAPSGIIQVFGEGIFSRYVLAFEIISLILTITVAGLTLFRGGTKCQK